MKSQWWGPRGSWQPVCTVRTQMLTGVGRLRHHGPWHRPRGLPGRGELQSWFQSAEKWRRWVRKNSKWIWKKSSEGRGTRHGRPKGLSKASATSTQSFHLSSDFASPQNGPYSLASARRQHICAASSPEGLFPARVLIEAMRDPVHGLHSGSPIQAYLFQGS